MATTDPITGMTINDQGDAATGGYQIGQVVVGMRTLVTPRFTTTAARDSAFAASGVTLIDGMFCTVAGRLYQRYGGVWQLRSGGPLIIDTPADSGIASALNSGSNRGLHATVAINQPFGAGVPFIGEVVAQCYATVQGGSELALGAVADPGNAGVRHGRENNSSGTAEARTVNAFGVIDSGTSDSYSFQPILRQLSGACTPSADVRLSFSVAKVWPKNL